MRKVSIRLAVSIAALVAVTMASGAQQSVAAASCLQPPVSSSIAQRFVGPKCPWCSGRRGITYNDPAGTAVVAAASGRVSFVGTVVGTRCLVIDVPGGGKHTYGGISTQLSRGSAVVRGQKIGRSAGGLYFGVRKPGVGGATAGSGLVYVDPEPLLGRWRGPVRLVPVDGRRGNKPRTLRSVC